MLAATLRWTRPALTGLLRRWRAPCHAECSDSLTGTCQTGGGCRMRTMRRDTSHKNGMVAGSPAIKSPCPSGPSETEPPSAPRDPCPKLQVGRLLRRRGPFHGPICLRRVSLLSPCAGIPDQPQFATGPQVRPSVSSPHRPGLVRQSDNHVLLSQREWSAPGRGQDTWGPGGLRRRGVRAAAWCLRTLDRPAQAPPSTGPAQRGGPGPNCLCCSELLVRPHPGTSCACASFCQRVELEIQS